MGTMAGMDLTKMADTLMNPPSKEGVVDREKGKGKYVYEHGKGQVWVPEPVQGSKHQGGPINAGGLYRLLPNEMVLDNQAVAALAQALTMVTMSQENAMAGGGNTTIVHAPVTTPTNFAQNSTNINQIHVPESALNNERTFRTVTHGQMALA
jgi:hypothetical protein